MDQVLIEPDVTRPAIEWQTALLAVAIYGGWLALTYWHATLPLWLLIPSGAWLTCWHSSLQHEILHGHPTRSAAINRALGYPPLTLWLPYDRYCATHLQHHHDERLTDPLDDPESRYVTPQDWRRLGALGRLLVRVQTTLAGRLIVGPFWAIGSFWRDEARDAIAAVPGRRRIWAGHLIAVAILLLWLHFVCAMKLAFYFAVFALGGTSLMLIRSFAEHRADAAVIKRTAVVEGYGPLAWLYLFNNLHAAHHARPGLPWYRLAGFFRANRAALVDPARGPYYAGYGEVFRRFLLRPHDAPIHPLGRIPRKVSP